MEKIIDKEKAIDMFNGQTKELILPSGYKVTIREQNGNDDDILSNKHLAEDLSNIDHFLSSLIINTNLPFAKGNRLSPGDIPNMVLRDKYYIIFASRVHSIGSELKFSFDWGKNSGGKITYTEDIGNYIWDFSKPFPQEGEEGYNPYAIEPYEDNPYELKEIELSSGKLLRFNFLNGFSEKELLKEPIERQSRLSEIRARNLQQKLEDGWKKVENFTFFSKKDMTELNFIINNLDSPFNGLTDIENPKTKDVIQYPLIKAESFLYPEEI